MLPFSAVDAVTVQSLELLSPKYSMIDKSLVIDLMERGKIFPSQHDSGVRKTLLMSIQPCRDAWCNGTHFLPGPQVARSALVCKQA